MKLTWLGRATIKLEINNKTIYIDPYFSENFPKEKADIILVSTWKPEHVTLESVKVLINDETKVYGPRELDAEIAECERITPEKEIEIDAIKIKAVKADEGMGFVINDVYYTGHTNPYAEMSKIIADTVIIPVRFASEDAKDALEIIKMVKARTAIPIEYEMSTEEANYLKELFKGTIIINPGQTIKINGAD